MYEHELHEDDEEGLLEELHGKNKKSLQRTLNSSRLNKHDMDEVFMGDEF